MNITTSTENGRIRIYLSWGMGVESTAILLRWLLDPSSRWVIIAGDRHQFSLDDLVVVTSQTGSEHADTKEHCERFILPFLALENIRLVQVARAGHSETDGVMVLDDTRSPAVMHTRSTAERPYYSLADELFEAGTVPQSSGEHRCALKFKAWVIETWLAHELAGTSQAFGHAFGYNSQEVGRVEKSDAGIEARRLKAKRTKRGEMPALRHVAFGFNSEEVTRIDRARAFDADNNRVGCYPLLAWSWTRQDCIDYIRLELGVEWLKSACGWCPFNELVYSPKKHGSAGIERLQANVDIAVEGLLLERMSLALNPRATLYRRVSLRSLATDEAVVEAFQRKLDTMEWAVYRVRRIYKGPGVADRCVQRLVKGTYHEAHGAFGWQAGELGEGSVTRQHEMYYAYVTSRGEGSAKAGDVEEFYVAAPAITDDKSPYGLEKFDVAWRKAIAKINAQGA